jgi:CPA2 family monovalent cation:H+ antiporter-2
VSDTADLRDILIVLLAAVAVVPVFRRLGGSAVLGYLIAGALIGPSGLGLVEVGRTAVLARFGVVFLLFSVGLELSVERIARLRRYVFGLGAAQVLATTILLWVALQVVGVGRGPALVLGSGLALSSTAVVMQMLVERRELATAHGRIAFSVLLFQDLAVVPLLTLVPLLGQSGRAIGSAIGLALLKALVVLVAIVALGRLGLRPILRAVTRGGNPELFTGIALLLILGLGWLTEQAGLSMALGAFLAGLLIAETEYRPQIEGDIQPFRGVLLALFFMTVGMRMELSLLVTEGPLLLGLLAGLLIIKTVVLAVLGPAFGLSGWFAPAVGLMLAQGGEFGFVLFVIGAQGGALPVEQEHMATLLVGLSMAVTPLLLVTSRALVRRPARTGPGGGVAVEQDAIPRDHVLIAGFGRVGQTLARLLEDQAVPYLALDLDPERVAEARRRGLPVHFGDASRTDVLKAAGVERARLAVITLDNAADAERAVRGLHQVLPGLPTLVRAHDTRHCEQLIAAGAAVVVPEIVEGSLQLGGALLRHLGGSAEEVEQVLQGLRRQTYAPLAELVDGELDAAERPSRRAFPGHTSTG